MNLRNFRTGWIVAITAIVCGGESAHALQYGSNKSERAYRGGSRSNPESAGDTFADALAGCNVLNVPNCKEQACSGNKCRCNPWAGSGQEENSCVVAACKRFYTCEVRFLSAIRNSLHNAGVRTDRRTRCAAALATQKSWIEALDTTIECDVSDGSPNRNGRIRTGG